MDEVFEVDLQLAKCVSFDQAEPIENKPISQHECSGLESRNNLNADEYGGPLFVKQEYDTWDIVRHLYGRRIMIGITHCPFCGVELLSDCDAGETTDCDRETWSRNRKEFKEANPGMLQATRKI